ncbi:MAG: ROK family protein [Anaerolineales bacterium]|nr:ROK family protein [Anaerolineales bacterium]MDW8447892.1 ROK family protein [Anaerolineales bacterium]
MLAGIEAGGSKTVCVVGRDAHHIFDRTVVPTTIPAETLPKLVAYFKECERRFEPIEAIGVAAFGPLEVHPSSPEYGRVGSTPKLAWQGFHWVQALRQAFSLPIYVDTDVNGAALAEWRWGAAQHLDTFLYLTVGTGIGGGGIINGNLIHGRLHPEMGHIRIPHDRERDPFPGCCPYHGNCLEGLASGEAIRRRWGKEAQNLAPDHPAWELEAEYLALAMSNFIFTLSPQRILLGGGVMKQAGLIEAIRRKTLEYCAGYLPYLAGEIEHLIAPPRLGDWAGSCGALALAATGSSSAAPSPPEFREMQ